jgi:hypothetical protein
MARTCYQSHGEREVYAVPRKALMSDRLLRRSGPAHLAWCRGRLSKNNVQTSAYGHVRPAAHRGFYLAIARSAVCAPPVLRCPSLNCDQTKPGQAPRQQFPCRLIAVVMPTLWWPHVRHVRQMDRSQDAGAAAVVPVVCRSDAGKATSRRVSVGRGNVRCCGKRMRERRWQYRRD